MGSPPPAAGLVRLNPRIATIKARLAEIEEERQRLLAELEILATARPSSGPLGVPASETAPSTPEERLALFMRLFCCRTDVFPRLWESKKKGTTGYSPACKVEWIRGRCGKPRVKCGDCRNQAFLALDESVIQKHLQGNLTAGVYAIREDDACLFLAADFDDEHWGLDAMTYKAAAREMGVGVYVERSRSGRGGHAWIFFEGPIPAGLARRLGTLILSRAMARQHHIGFESYDRLYPSQDTMPKGGFGSLIALPLQAVPSRAGNSLFVDEELKPYEDQWDFLAGVRLLSATDVTAVLDEYSPRPTDRSDSEPAEPELVEAEASLAAVVDTIRGAYSGTISFSLSRRLEITIVGLPSRLVTTFKRAATFANPKFFELQRMRFSTWNTPRYVCCAELSDDRNRMILPRGLLSRCLEIARMAGGRCELSDRRPVPASIPLGFTGELQPPQREALAALLAEDSGVLVAPPGAGKTVIACALIAERKLPTLVLVHRKQLADQWRKQLAQFTDLEEGQIGGPDTKKREENGVAGAAIARALRRCCDAADPQP